MLPPRLANHLWHLSGMGHHRRFQSALIGPSPTQRRLLLALLKRNADTTFGHSHRFASIRSIADFQDAVPLSEYDDYVPAIDRIARGEPNILTRDPVTRLVPTSGSTSARKLIPWTAGLQRELNRAIAAWTGDLFRRTPSLKAGPAYWSVSPAIAETQPADFKVPVGFDDDTDYLAGLAGKVIGGIMAVPPTVRHLADTDTFRLHVLLHLVAARDLRLISVWHPTFFTLLLDSLPSHWEAIVEALRTGVIPDLSPRALHAGFQKSFRPDPNRADELSSLAPDQPGAIWPDLALLRAWGDPTAPEVRDLTRRFPNTPFQPKGILATEAFASIPFRRRHPLAITSHFFEFLDDNGRIHLAHEVKTGQRYEVVVTTSGGLYRYRLRDQVDVTGFLENTPCLRFAGRAGNVSDLRGEKLDPRFVADTIDRITHSFADTIRFRVLTVDPDADPPGYTLILVADPTPDLDHLAANLETALCENPHYRLCRFLGQLAPARTRLESPGFIDRHFTEQASSGRILGNIKPGILTSPST